MFREDRPSRTPNQPLPWPRLSESPSRARWNGAVRSRRPRRDHRARCSSTTATKLYNLEGPGPGLNSRGALPLAGVRVLEGGQSPRLRADGRGPSLGSGAPRSSRSSIASSGTPTWPVDVQACHNVYRGGGPVLPQRPTAANPGPWPSNIKAPGGRGCSSPGLAGVRRRPSMNTLRAVARGQHLRIDVEDVRRDNPLSSNVRGTAFGPRGPPNAGPGRVTELRVCVWARSRNSAPVSTPPGRRTWPARFRPALR